MGRLSAKHLRDVAVELQAQDWASHRREFETRHRRAPAILHIGNIANNAYNNAKVLNEAGFSCDVVAYDYYHIMGCPEWEDADFLGDIGDHFAPDWDQVDLRGFSRPSWFAQGPLDDCMEYLSALRSDPVRAMALWRRLARRRRAHALSRSDDVGALRYLFLKRDRILPKLRTVGMELFRHSLEPMGRLGQFLLGPWERRFGGAAHAGVEARSGGAGDGKDAYDFDRRVRQLIERYDQLFPEREDRLEAVDFEPWRYVMPRWRSLFAHYDLIEAYSTDPLLPMLAGFRPYVAYEHGTIREIPFEPTAIGRLTALSYALADEVIITNPDCVEAARKLGVQRYRFVPHLIDRKYHDPAVGSSGQLPAGVREPYVFCPARHDFKEKGSDILVRAFAEVARDRPDLQLVTPSWGVDLDRSKDLMRELGIGDRVALI